VSSALRVFDLVFIATNGGPGTSTRVPVWEIYQRAFLEGRIGSAAAIAVLLALVIFLVGFLITRIGETRPDQ